MSSIDLAASISLILGHCLLCTPRDEYVLIMSRSLKVRDPPPTDRNILRVRQYSTTSIVRYFCADKERDFKSSALSFTV